MKYVNSHFSMIVDVRKLVTIAPATLPKLPQDYQNPMIVPRPFFPNQLAKIELQHGHPSDYASPLIANRNEKYLGSIQSYYAAIAINDVTTVTQMNDMISSFFGLK